MKTPGPLPVRALESLRDDDVANRFAGEATPAATVSEALAKALMLESRVVGRFVMTRSAGVCWGES